MMINSLVAAKSAQELLQYADPRPKATEEELLDALDAELSDEHCLVVARQLHHIDDLEGQIAQLRKALVAGLQPQRGLLATFATAPHDLKKHSRTLLMRTEFMDEDLRS